MSESGWSWRKCLAVGVMWFFIFAGLAASPGTFCVVNCNVVRAAR